MNTTQAIELVTYAEKLFPKWGLNPETRNLWARRLARFARPEIVKGAIEDHRASHRFNAPNLPSVVEKAAAAHENLAAFDAGMRRPQVQTRTDYAESLREERARIVRLFPLDERAVENATREAANRAMYGLWATMSLNHALERVRAALPGWDGWLAWASEHEEVNDETKDLSGTECLRLASLMCGAVGAPGRGALPRVERVRSAKQTVLNERAATAAER